MRVCYDGFCALLVAHKDLTEEYFVSKAGAVDGYAKQLFTRFYRSTFAESTDVLYLYETYYKPEYDSFKVFLMAFYELEEEWVDRLMQELEMNNDYRLYDYDPLSTGENLDDFMWSENYWERFEKLIKMEY